MRYAVLGRNPVGVAEAFLDEFELSLVEEFRGHFYYRLGKGKLLFDYWGIIIVTFIRRSLDYVALSAVMETNNHPLFLSL